MIQQITENVFQVTLPVVNVFLVDLPSGLLLIDAGPKGSQTAIFDAIRSLGKQPADLRYIIITHAHYDHAGGLAEILRETKPVIYASPLCAAMLKKGTAFQPKGKIASLLLKLTTFNGRFPLSFSHNELIHNPITAVKEGDTIPTEKGLKVIYAPGHTQEQIALFYPIKEAIMFAADVAENVKRLKPAHAYQSAAVNQQSLEKIISFPFEKIVFGHGQPEIKEAFDKLYKK